MNQVAVEFPHQLRSNEEAPDAVEVYRKALAGEKDHSVVILTIGYMSNLKNLLESQPDSVSPLNGEELVRQKVKEWVYMGGNFPVDDAKDNVNFTRDPEPAVYAIRNWPTKIMFIGREIGHTIFVGEALKNTSISNPVRRAYELHRGCYNPSGNWDHQTADPCAVMYAVRGLRDYWDAQAHGYIDIKNDCTFQWKQQLGRKQGYLIQKMDREKMGEIMEELMVRPPRRLEH